MTHLPFIRQEAQGQTEGAISSRDMPRGKGLRLILGASRENRVFVPNGVCVKNFPAFPLKAHLADMSESKGIKHSLRFQSRAAGE